MNRVLCTIALGGIVALSTLLAGCQSASATMRLAPTATPKQQYVQRFSQAYAVQRVHGEIEVVLTNSQDQPLSQIMHLRLLWKPMSGTKTDQPSTTNAIIDWYIIDGPSILRYKGAGLVLADQSGKQMWVSVKNATLKLATRTGDLSDPIGPATLTGTFNAKIDAAKVDSVLIRIKAANAVASNDEPASSIDH